MEGDRLHAEFDGGLSRSDAEDVAARDQDFISAQYYWQWLADYVVNRKYPQKKPRLASAGRGFHFSFFIWKAEENCPPTQFS